MAENKSLDTISYTQCREYKKNTTLGLDCVQLSEVFSLVRDEPDYLHDESGATLGGRTDEDVVLSHFDLPDCFQHVEEGQAIKINTCFNED